jgi:hypothetical protein
MRLSNLIHATAHLVVALTSVWRKAEELNPHGFPVIPGSNRLATHAARPSAVILLSWSALWEEYADHLPTKEAPMTGLSNVCVIFRAGSMLPLALPQTRRTTCRH